MGLDFDLVNFIEDMKACKPPYKCPFKDCGRVYKTFSGINGHIQSHDVPSNNSSRAGTGPPGTPTRSPSPHPFFTSPVKESLVFNEATKKLEFEAEGHLHRFSIYDALELVDKEDWETTLPPKGIIVNEDPNKTEEEAADEGPKAQPKTPNTPRFSHKKKKGLKSTKPPPSEAADVDKYKSELVDKRPLKLPEAHYTIIKDYKIDDAPPMPSSYYRFIEKPAEEQDEEVEYDMDEEDVAWLSIINGKRETSGLQKITEDQFELLMDRLEKESYFHVQSNGSDYNAPIDDDAICCVCMDGECSNTNVILFCDLCNLAVHQECYGVPYIPEGQWLCRRCLQSPSRSVECCLCPNRGGAFKQTDDGRWAHVVCGLWIPEVRFANTVFLEPIDSIDNIPPARWKLSCRVCKQRGVGACIQCHKTNCYTAFHVTCGLLAGLHMKMDTVREPSASGLSVTVRKTAFCDVHTPQDSDCKPKLDDVAALGISTPKQKGKSPMKKLNETSPVPVLFRGLMNFSPQCPWEKVQEIAGLISVQRKNQFFQRLMAYWTLKRQTRNGVPLIRRLQFAKAMRPDKKPETPQKNAHHSKKKKEREKSLAKKAKDEFKAMLEQRKLLRRLRQDLERVRLLCELIRKREQRKRELIGNQHEIIIIKIFPFIQFLTRVLESLELIDTQEIFSEPVSLDDVPDYLDHISKPMDFQTMREKLNNFEYDSIEKFEADFNIMVENCLSYNERDTIFYRAGVKMRDVGGSIIRQSRRSIESIGFDEGSGLLTAERSNLPETVSDDKLMKEIDTFMNSEEKDELSAELQLKKLLELQDKALLMHHPVAKVKRQKLLKQEIIKTRRKLSLDKSSKATPNIKSGKSNEKTSSKKSDTSKRKSKMREVSPVSTENLPTPGRRLRAGKEITEPVEKKQSPNKKGKKRTRTISKENVVSESPASKKQKTLSEEVKTPSKAGLSGSPAKSPAGVNRRNAILFTRKKQSVASSTPEPTDVKRGEEKVSDKITELSMEEQETEVQSPAPISNPLSPSLSGSEALSNKKKPLKKKRGRKPKGAGPSVDLEEDDKDSQSKSAAVRMGSDSEDWQKKNSASFQHYRRGGELGETDEDDTQSESATDALGTSEDDSTDESDSDDSSANSSSALKIPLEPLDLIWAKCRGYPWYPALIINPKMPRTGYLHNGVPIPVPPDDVLEMANTHQTPHYLILFFDAKRTWQWLTRDKLEPLGVDSELDKAKLVQSKKPSERKAVKKAYEDAILHRCRVTGEDAVVSEESCTDEEMM